MVTADTQARIAPGLGRAPSAAVLPGAPSLLLDVIRFAAAFTVALGHISQKYFGTGLPEMTSLATAAVAVFFVLSGFVIRYITLTRYSDLRRYAIDRAARVYSVVLPAIFVTLVVHGLALRINPGFYMSNWGPFTSHIFGRVLVTVTFLAQSWCRDYTLLSNGPFWSLSYECVYYAFYGIAFYGTGIWRWIGLAAVFAASGFPIFLLFPAWLLGCVAFDVYLAGRFTPRSAGRFAALSLLIMGVNALRFYTLPHVTDLPSWLGHVYLIQGWIAIPTALLILFGSRALRGVRIDEARPIIRGTRWLANATFLLYLVHFPLFVLIAAVVPYKRSSAVAQVLVLAAVVLIASSLASATDRVKNAMRSLFSKLWPAKASRAQQTPAELAG